MKKFCVWSELRFNWASARSGITGGEPLVRKGVFEFIQALHQVDGIRDVSLTTNGVLLKDHVDAPHGCGASSDQYQSGHPETPRSSRK